MMNFEERKAEIFRRSDERIKTRKRNRKRILLSCMSLAIFVSVIGAVAAPSLMREFTKKSEAYWSDGLTEELPYESSVDSVGKDIEANSVLCFGGISLSIPDGWEYDTFEGDDNFSPNSEDRYYGIGIWPSGHGGGKITIEFCPYFGVCGTGLTEKKITIGSYEGLIGSYDKGKTWCFIALIGDQRDYVILNDGADEWWGDYGNEAMAILDTLVVETDIEDTEN
ncbi:MAG: hypothetical protein J1E05_06525 [Eubacterium sp.]|nr:hypothetical protein [Eubacterium sp.]